MTNTKTVLAAMLLGTTLAACSSEIGSSASSRPKKSCVYEVKSTSYCSGGYISPGEWRSTCDANSDCTDLAESSNDGSGGSCVFDYQYRNKRVVSGGCPGDDTESGPTEETSSDTTVTSTAEPQCNAFLQKLCGRWVACGQVSGSVSTCVAAAQETLDCSRAVTVSSGYTSCMSQLGTISCSALESGLPSTCKAVIGIE